MAAGFVDLPSWPLSHHNLMMVAGADDMPCNIVRAA